MAQMVYINEIRRDSFLHFSTDGEGYCLRDFSPSGTGPAVAIERQSEGRTASTIRELSRKPGNRIIEVSGQGMGVGEYAFWHEQTLKLNAQLIPVNHEDIVRKIEVEKKRHEANSEWWKKVRLMIVALTALVGLAAAIIAFWR